MDRSTILAFFLRGGSASAKILFVAYLGYVNKAEVVGQFAIFSTLAILFTQIAGFEIHQVIARKYHSLSFREKFKLYFLNGIASIGVYFLILPLLVMLYYELLLNFWFLGCLVLVLEHYSTELYRFYIINLEPFKASLILFVKNVGWVIFFIFFAELGIVSINIYNILIFWSFFVFAASFMGSPSIGIILDGFKNIDFKNLVVDFLDILVKARLFILVAISISGVTAVDKLILERFFDFEEIGEFYFYLTISSIPGLIVSLGIGATLWPKCIRLAAIENNEECEKLWRKMLKYYWVLLVSISSVMLIILCVLAIFFHGERINFQSLQIIFYLILAGAGMAIIEPYKLKMYINKNDSALLFGAWLHFMMMCAFVFYSAKNSSLEYIAITMAVVNFVAYIFYKFSFPEKIINRLKNV